MPFANTYYNPWPAPPPRPRRPRQRIRPGLPPQGTQPVIWLCCRNAPAPVRH